MPPLTPNAADLDLAIERLLTGISRLGNQLVDQGLPDGELQGLDRAWAGLKETQRVVAAEFARRAAPVVLQQAAE